MHAHPEAGESQARTMLKRTQRTHRVVVDATPEDSGEARPTWYPNLMAAAAPRHAPRVRQRGGDHHRGVRVESGLRR